jgi:hypothetical protein
MFDDLLDWDFCCFAFDNITHVVHHFSGLFKSCLDWCQVIWNPDYLIMDVRSVLAYREEDRCVCVIVCREPLVLVDDYRRKGFE